MNEFGFREQLAMSHGEESSGDVCDVLTTKIPGAIKVSKANERDDRSGTDYWIEHVRGAPISVDCKVRTTDPIQKYRKDDLFLETWSVVEAKRPGWTLDESKRTDYILWWFTPTKRWVLIPFHQLCYSFRKRVGEWTARFPVKTQRTNDRGRVWHSEAVVVPRQEIFDAINEDFSGNPRRGHALQRHVDNAPAPRPRLPPPGVVGYTRPDRGRVVIGVEPSLLNLLRVRVGDTVQCTLGELSFAGVVGANSNVVVERDLPVSREVRISRP